MRQSFLTNLPTNELESWIVQHKAELDANYVTR